jgi:predicted transcriptional regulator
MDAVEDLKRRMDAIGLPQKRLAELASLDEDTVGRTLSKKTSPVMRTFDKMRAAVEAEEKRLLAELIARHGAAAPEAVS